MRELKQSTGANVMVFMADSADHIAGKTGLTLVITASKDGGAFATITPTVTERGNGWYNLALTTTHTNTLGDLVVRATGTASDPSEFISRVITLDKAATGGKVPATIAAGDIATDAITAASVKADAVTKIQTGLATPTNITAGTITTTTNLTNLPTIPADWFTAAGLAADAVAEIQAGLASAANLSVVAGYLDTEIADIRARLPAALVGGKMDSTVGDKTGFSLAATGLDAIAVADPGGVAGHTTLPKLVVALYRRFFGKMTLTTTQMKTYADDGTTVNTTQPVSDVAGTQTQGTSA